MKKTINIILSTCAIALLSTTSAMAREFACPHNQVRTEITTDLPSPWHQTPQVGSLRNTRISNIAGEPHLICEYSAYGTTVSVMRPKANRFPNCTPNATGFTCLPAAAAAVTHKTGSLSIRQTFSADLDNGTVSSGGADIFFEAETATRRYIKPINGARIGIYSGTGGISKEDCVATPKSANRIPVASLPVGTYVCALTSDRRHSVFRINAPIGVSPGTLQIGFTTWQ